MAYPTSRASIACPQCGKPLTMTIEQVIDAGQDPSARDRLLKGEINVLRCTNCGATGPIAAPMVYHDPARSLLLAFLPHEMQLSMEQEEKEIGRLTNMVLENTPPEGRKSYLLNPVRVMTYDGLVEKILEAEGISPDDLRKQTQKIQLVMRMAQAVGDDKKLSALVDEHRDEIDYNFLMLITVTMQQAAETNDQATATRYSTLRQKIIDQLGLTAEDLPDGRIELQVDDLIDRMLAAPAQELQAVVAANRPLLDYQFFMHLSSRAEQSEEAEKTKLFALRKKLVEMTDEMDRLAREAMERAARQLNDLLQAEDIEARIQEMYHDLDEAFLVVLSANVEQAKEQGREDIVSVLMSIYKHVVSAMESRLRPELRAVNQLLQTEDIEERRAQLRQELRTYNPAGFIEMLEAIAADLEDSGRAQPDVLERLYTIADEAREIAATELDGQFTPPQQELFANDERAARDSRILTPEDERRKNSGDRPEIVLP
jgi:hypothetical protein